MAPEPPEDSLYLPRENEPEAGGTAPHPAMTAYYASPAERQQWVERMFDATAEHYDGITDLMSFGSGRWYRRWALQRHGLAAGMRLLDAGAGTGTIATAGQQIVGSEGEVVALDPSLGMLDVAKRRGVERTARGMADDLPFPERSFDMLTMGYALRHVGNLDRTFKEYHRVLDHGGRALILEITPPANALGYRLLRLYLRDIIPLLARILRRSRDARLLMNYYWDTIDHCVPPERILQAMRDAGFEDVRRHIVLGIFSEYTGVKPGLEANAS